MNTSGAFKSEEDLLKYDEPNTDSFWDIGNYKKVVKRIEDGQRLCTELAKMAQERAEIESKYAKNLQHWSKKWEDLVEKGPEYGSVESSWKSSLQEPVKIAEIHTEMSQRLSDEIVDGIHSWKNLHYHKSIVHFKEVKRAEEGFSSAQKPWAKKLQKCLRAMKNYHHCAKEVETLLNQVHTADISPEISAEQCQKLRAKHEKAETERDRALEKYKDRLGEAQRYRSRYEEDMTAQFTKCQEAELARLEFFKDTLYKMEGILDITKTDRLQRTYAEYCEYLDGINPEEDLRWYALNYGTGMSYSWPEFEEYTAGQGKSSTLSLTPRPTHKAPPSSSHTLPAGSATTGTFRPLTDHSSGGSGSPSLTTGSTQLYPQDTFDEFDDEEGGEEEWLEPPPAELEPSSPDALSGSRSGSEGPREQGTSGSGRDSGEAQGKLMRALYDYTGTSGDDLNFKEGDMVRIMYEGEDGWAEGAMGDKYGYVPISYFKPL